MPNAFFAKFRRFGPEVTALVILVPLIVVLGFILTRSSPETALVASPSATPIETHAPQSSPIGAVIPPTASPPSQSQEILLEISAPGNAKTYRLATQSETTVADLLIQAQREQGLQLEVKDFGGSLGIFVEAINGVRNDTARKLYWSLYVNGAFSQLGASSIKVRPGNTVTWKYESAHEDN